MRYSYNSNYHQGYTPPSNFFLPKGVKYLMIANVVVFVLQIISDKLNLSFSRYFALTPGDVVYHFQFWQLLTSAFMHSVRDIFHLLFNMLILFFFGPTVEKYYGTKKFIYFYLSAAIFAGFIYTFTHILGHDNSPMIGASGALMAMLVFCAFIIPEATVYFALLFPMKLRVLVWILVGIDMYRVLINSGGIAATAHLGGALFGFLVYRYAGRISRYFQSIRENLLIEYQNEQAKDYGETPKKQSGHDRLRAQVDQLLDKIREKGIQSLTNKEKQFLQNASKRYRNGE